MGFYFRKSISVGPLRFNLSKSGIGVSAGIRGLRIGSGPRGNYVHVGRGGLYYRHTLDSKNNKPSPGGGGYQQQQISNIPQTHGPMQEIASTAVSQMVDSTSAGIVAELKQKRDRIELQPIAWASLVVLTGILIAIQASYWLIIPLGIGLLGLAIKASSLDKMRKTVVIMYDLEDEALAVYQSFFDSISLLASSKAIWHLSAQGRVHDSKYHAGAGHVVSRSRTSFLIG